MARRRTTRKGAPPPHQLGAADTLANMAELWSDADWDFDSSPAIVVMADENTPDSYELPQFDANVRDRVAQKDRNQEIADAIGHGMEEIEAFNRMRCSTPGEACSEPVIIITVSLAEHGLAVGGFCETHIAGLRIYGEIFGAEEPDEGIK